jgi:glycosyltransferase involved in cell wall biosynthesis
VHVLYLIDSLAAGGAERSLAAMAPGYSAAGVRLDVGYFRETPGVHEDLRDGGAGVLPLVADGTRPGWLRASRDAIRSLRPDVVHTTLFDADVIGRIAARSTGVPAVSSLVNEGYGPEHYGAPGMRRGRLHAARALDALTARSVRRFHAVTAQVAAAMVTRLRLRPERIEVIPRGRDPKVLGVRTEERRREVRNRLGIRPGDAMLVAAARHEHQKGLDVVVDAKPAILRAVPTARLEVAGRDGAATADLRARIARLGIGAEVSLLGARTDVADLLAAADVFVLPSRWEGLPGVVLEAMALEAPIVATDLPAVREAVGGSEGAALVRPGEPVELADAVTLMVSDPCLAGRRASFARARFDDRYTVDRVVERMLAFYRTALAQTGPRWRKSGPHGA